jgi:hypothetical protein
MPALVSCRFNHSCPLRQTLAEILVENIPVEMVDHRGTANAVMRDVRYEECVEGSRRESLSGGAKARHATAAAEQALARGLEAPPARP